MENNGNSFREHGYTTLVPCTLGDMARFQHTHHPSPEQRRGAHAPQQVVALNEQLVRRPSTVAGLALRVRDHGAVHGRNALDYDAGQARLERLQAVVRVVARAVLVLRALALDEVGDARGRAGARRGAAVKSLLLVLVLVLCGGGGWSWFGRDVRLCRAAATRKHAQVGQERAGTHPRPPCWHPPPRRPRPRRQFRRPSWPRSRTPRGRPRRARARAPRPWRAGERRARGTRLAASGGTR